MKKNYFVLNYTDDDGNSRAEVVSFSQNVNLICIYRDFGTKRNYNEGKSAKLDTVAATTKRIAYDTMESWNNTYIKEGRYFYTE